MTVNGMLSKITVNREATYRQGSIRSFYGTRGEKMIKVYQASPIRNFQKIHQSTNQKNHQNTYLSGEGMKLKFPK